MEEKEKKKYNMSIKEARKMINISQSKASKILGLPLKTLQNWEQEVRSCPEWLKDIIVEKLIEWSAEDMDKNADKYLEEYLMNNYLIKYIEYGKEKEMEADASGGTKELKKALEYWQGAYSFERCTAPTILSIKTPKGKEIMESYIQKFNEKSKDITKDVLEEMDYQDMSWAKPKSTKVIYERMTKRAKEILEERMPAEGEA